MQDILVLMQEPVPPLSFMRAKPIGAMRMVDGGEEDDKIIAVCADDPAYKHYNDISELPAHRWKEIRHFFLTYKRGQLEEKYGNNNNKQATNAPAKPKIIRLESVRRRDGGDLGVSEFDELPTLSEDTRAVSYVADPFKHEPLSPSKGVTVSEEQIGADEAKKIIVASQKMYAEAYPEKAAAAAKK
jgi:Inorganic pyrophosphatase